VTSECFVYIALPGEAEFVTAGRFERTIDRNGVATGRFVYGKSYRERANAVPLHVFRSWVSLSFLLSVIRCARAIR
jgi:hypothetical protein